MLQLASCRMGILSSLGPTVQGMFWKGNSSMLRFFNSSSCKLRLLGTNVNESYCGVFSKTYTLHYIAAGAECTTRGVTVRCRKSSNAIQELLYSTDVSSITTCSTSCNFTSIAYSDVSEILENQNLKHIVTLFVFDLETTGLHRETARVTEIAFRDLQGGLNSCFQTLVNPEQVVRNSHIHGISTEMVNRPEVPRMKELIPILFKYIKSRQKPGGPVLFVAHNARIFDLPILSKEFSRCSYEIPRDWFFLDSQVLAREAMKLIEPRVSQKLKLNLSALGEYYRIPRIGSDHRAMSDVNLLSEVFGRLTFDLKLSVSDLLERAIRPSEVIKLKNKKSRS